MPKKPKSQGDKLTQIKDGYYGKFGSGGNVEVSYIQSVMDFEFLNEITLIEDIKGSDKWQVRDLFQRNVDQNRVEDDLIPFFKNEKSIKFFAPLALVLLPMNGSEVNNKLVEIQSDRSDEYTKHKLGNSVEFNEYEDSAAYSNVKWNPQKIKLVAVDGQHRVTALKMLLHDDQENKLINEMKIPILIIGFSKMHNAAQKSFVPPLLDVVRQTFVYINNKSQKINESRAILLDNEDINCVAVQELVQRAHDNDNEKDKKRNIDVSSIPLVIFDWRGEEKNGRAIQGPASIFSVRDAKDWFTEYLLGDIKQKNSEKVISTKIIPRLNLDSLKARLNSDDLKGLNHENSEIARKQINNIIPDGKIITNTILRPSFNLSLERLEFCFSKINNPFSIFKKNSF